MLLVTRKIICKLIYLATTKLRHNWISLATKKIRYKWMLLATKKVRSKKLYFWGKKLWFSLIDEDEFTFNEGHLHSMMISCIKAQKMLSEPCARYLTHVADKPISLSLEL